MLIKRKRVLSRSGQVVLRAGVIELIVEALLIILSYPDVTSDLSTQCLSTQ
jgi:hypothetical protein